MLYLTREQIADFVNRIGQPEASVLLNAFFNRYRHHLASSDVADLYDAGYFDRIGSHAVHEVVANRFAVTVYSRFAFDYLRSRISNDTRVLDFGCGAGQFCAAVASLGAATVMGLDMSAEAIERARAAAAGLANLEFGVGTAADLEADHFNYITLNDVTEHLSDDELHGLLRDLHRALAQGGELLIHTPNGLALCNGTDRSAASVAYVAYLKFRSGWRGHERTVDQIYYDQVHINVKSFRQLRSILRRSGFAARVEYDEPRGPVMSQLSSNMLVIAQKL